MVRVLLLDGDAITLKAMQTVLQRGRYHVISSQSGRAGLSLLTQCDPHVVIIDLQLEDMNGLDMLGALRLSGKRVPSVLILRFGHEQDRNTAMKLGAFDCIEEPLSPSLLLSVVHHATSGWVDPDGLEKSHALSRWADVVVRGIRSSKDTPTLDHWGRAVAVSRGGIRNWCYTARLSPRRSLQFMRVLRAVILQQRTAMEPEDLLDIVDRRTLTKLLTISGGTPTTLPRSVSEFLDGQRIIQNDRAIAAVRAALPAEYQAAADGAVRPDLALVKNDSDAGYGKSVAATRSAIVTHGPG